MARLPEPGGDSGTWGGVLNDYLKVSHNDDGTLKNAVVNGTTLQDSAVSANKIATGNAPANGQVLSYTGSQLEWTTVSATGTVDKESIGLGNVDNTSDVAKPISNATQTALDAKANTAHTHTASDITSGVIDSSRLPDATDTTKGVVELATEAEALAGSDTTKAVTSAGVAAKVAAAVTAANYSVLFVDSLGDIPPGTAVDTLVVVRAA